MAGNSLYSPTQAALDTRWIQPWSEAFRVSRFTERHLCAADLELGTLTFMATPCFRDILETRAYTSLQW